MTMTVNSASSPYCTGAQFVTLLDWRTFSQLASDTDVPLSSSAALQSSAILAAQLRVGAGKIEMAVTVGNRYNPADLTLLITPTITNSGYMLMEMNAALAAYGMFGRRFEGIPEHLRQMIDTALLQLEALSEGENVLGLAEAQAAGIMTDYRESATDVENRNLPSFIARRVFGRRANRYPYPGAGTQG